MKKTYKHLSLFERQRLFQWYSELSLTPTYKLSG